MAMLETLIRHIRLEMSWLCWNASQHPPARKHAGVYFRGGMCSALTSEFHVLFVCARVAIIQFAIVSERGIAEFEQFDEHRISTRSMLRTRTSPTRLA